jgi:hypothetical protein
MRIDMNIAALRNVIANVRVMIAVVRGNALRHQHSGSRTSRHAGTSRHLDTCSLSRRDDFSNPTGIFAVAQWLQNQGWQWLTMVEGRLYLPAVIKPAVVARATKPQTSLRPFRSY